MWQVLYLSISCGERTGLSDDIKTSVWMPSVSKQTIKQKLSLPEPVWLQNTYKLPNNEKKTGPDLGDFGLFSDPTKTSIINDEARPFIIGFSH
jgi:hypothetical protein